MVRRERGSRGTVPTFSLAPVCDARTYVKRNICTHRGSRLKRAYAFSQLYLRELISPILLLALAFQVLDKVFAYPIPFSSWKLFFDPNEVEKVESLTKKSIWVHYCNYRRTSTKSEMNYANQPLFKIMFHNCPITIPKIAKMEFY